MNERKVLFAAAAIVAISGAVGVSTAEATGGTDWGCGIVSEYYKGGEYEGSILKHSDGMRYGDQRIATYTHYLTHHNEEDGYASDHPGHNSCS